ncbi:MAG TPA: multicopper oxidase domain-containing protein [Bryobacteraceae bacterium]|nr:multicopper oxidase domain-containing protein [Bryobacteraceae bacterium]
MRDRILCRRLGRRWRRHGAYPSVKLRMDFRNPEIVGTFVYHCHILEHEDAGMMGSIQIVPPQ